MSKEMESPEYLLKVIDIQFEHLWEELTSNGADFPLNDKGESAWTYLNNIKYVLDGHKLPKDNTKPCTCGKWQGSCKCD